MSTGTPLNVDVAAAGQGTKSLGRHLLKVARVLQGLLFFVFGLNGFLNFIPPPPPETIPEAAMAFSVALAKTGYMMPLIKGTEVLAGVLLLANRFVPLALTLLAPVIVNIVAYHVFLAPSGMVMTVIVLALEVYLAWAYRDVFRAMLAARVTPGAK
ncbi:DoxX family protein [Myxococcus sp. Y35]|uniref:DoxX family protein n=1 Tax=Pseudomyxococcus flavus TaxID=3115648 RepID=UPI003CF07AAD